MLEYELTTRPLNDREFLLSNLKNTNFHPQRVLSRTLFFYCMKNNLIFLIRKIWILSKNHNQDTIVLENAISLKKQSIITATRKGKGKIWIIIKLRTKEIF